MDVNPRPSAWTPGTRAEVRYLGAWSPCVVVKVVGGCAVVRLLASAEALVVPVRCTQTIRPEPTYRPWLMND